LTGERGTERAVRLGGVSGVLLIEDDPAVREGLELALTRHGHRVRAVESGEQGLDLLRTDRPDVVVLDLMLPGMDGFEVCRRIRAAGEVPVIMLTARGDDMDVVAGLEVGADDYVVKPVQPRVLEALERYGDLTIDRAGLVVARRGVPVSLAPTELRLLLELSGTPGRVHSRQQLLESVWEHGYFGDSRLVDACVQRLRAKIEADSTAPVYVQTVRGFGYRFGPV
jgi:DNA-binding response OmpR family regulator